VLLTFFPLVLLAKCHPEEGRTTIGTRDASPRYAAHDAQRLPLVHEHELIFPIMLRIRPRSAA